MKWIAIFLVALVGVAGYLYLSPGGKEAIAEAQNRNNQKKVNACINDANVRSTSIGTFIENGSATIFISYLPTPVGVSQEEADRLFNEIHLTIFECILPHISDGGKLDLFYVHLEQIATLDDKRVHYVGNILFFLSVGKEVLNLSESSGNAIGAVDISTSSNIASFEDVRPYDLKLGVENVNGDLKLAIERVKEAAK